MSKKMIFMLLNPVWGLTREMKRNFEHLVQKTQPRTCGRMVFKFFKKKANKVWKSGDLSRCDDIIRGGCGKKLRRFRTIYHVRCLQTKVSQKKNRSVEMDSVRFRVKVTIELGFGFKTFYIGNREHRLFMWNFCNFFDPFDNFNLLSAIIEL